MDKAKPGDRIVASQTEHMSARVPAGERGVLGLWWSDARGVARWEAGVREDLPFGRIEFLPEGFIELTFGDLPDWRPYVSVSGIAAATPIQCSMRYRFDGTEIWDDVPLNFADGRHVGVGGVSNGTLAGNNRWGGIRLACLPGFPGSTWGVEDLTFGYVQLGEPA